MAFSRLFTDTKGKDVSTEVNLGFFATALFELP